MRMATAWPRLRTVLLSNLTSPFGMALVGNTLYVANADALVSFPYTRGDTRITALPTMVTALPGGTINHHWTKNVVASPDGKRLYVSVGSNSNVGENGIDKEAERAAVWEVDPTYGQSIAFSPRGCAIRSGWRGCRRRACSGRR